MPLSTCLTHSSAECSLPCQGRTEAQETTRRSEHLAAHHERKSALLGKKDDEVGGSECKYSVLVLWSGESESYRVSPRRFVQRSWLLLRVPLLFKRIPAMRFPDADAELGLLRPPLSSSFTLFLFLSTINRNFCARNFHTHARLARRHQTLIFPRL